MTAWSLDTRFCASPLQQSYVPGSPTSSLSSHNSDESSFSQGSIASSQTSISSSNSWRDDLDSSQASGKSCAKFDAAALARQRSHADYRKSCLKSSSQCEDSWPSASITPCPVLTPTGLIHPRRSTFCPARVKPSLVRQSDRREDFVEYLVDTATQMVAVIWPTSSTSFPNGSPEVKNQVLPLRIFIKETLRRSRTSYSTLQVAMYYLILIKSKARLPRCDFPEDEPLDSTQCRVMHCGRRMFLAALILASKYLQDRNYSARAWSKISGLKIHEINSNELSFLAAVEWKLHISEETFLRWTDIVTTYTNSMHNFGPRAGLTKSITSSWTSLVKRLTPELEFTQTTWARPSAVHRPGPEFDIGPDRPATAFSLTAPKCSPTRPSLTEARKYETQLRIPPTPLLNSHLTTPVSTPSSTTANTPAQPCTGSPVPNPSTAGSQPGPHSCRPRTRSRPFQTKSLGLTLERTTSSESDLNSKHHSTSLGNEISSSNTSTSRDIACNSGLADLGIVSLLEAAKELGWSGDEADDEIVKETPLSSPKFLPQSLGCSPSSSNTCLQSPSTTSDAHSSDEGDMIAVHKYSYATVESSTGPSITSSAQATTRRKRRLNSSVDVTTFLHLHDSALGHYAGRPVPSADSDDVIMDDGADCDFRGQCDRLSSMSLAMEAQVSSRFAQDRVPIQRSSSGRKRVCCA